MGLVRYSSNKNRVYSLLSSRKNTIHRFFVNYRSSFLSGNFSLTGRSFNPKNFSHRKINFIKTETKHLKRYTKKLSNVYFSRKYVNSSKYLGNYLGFLFTLNGITPKAKILKYVTDKSSYDRPYLFIGKYVVADSSNINTSIIKSNLSSISLIRGRIINFKKDKKKYKILYNNLDYKLFKFYRQNSRNRLYYTYNSVKALNGVVSSISSSYSGLGVGHKDNFSFVTTKLKPTFTYIPIKLNLVKTIKTYYSVYNYSEVQPKIESLFNFKYYKFVNSLDKRFSGTNLKVRFSGTTPFIFMGTGFALLQKTNNSLRGLDYKSRFKKSMYSFLYPNQYKKSIFISKKKIIISRFVYNNMFKSSRRLNFSFKLIKNRFSNFFNSKKYNMSGLNEKFSGLGGKDVHMYSNSKQYITYKNEFCSKGLDNSDRLREVFIPRVRFKPGYQRLWRVARSSLKELLGLNYTYQYRLTRYLVRFNRFTSGHFFQFSEMSVDKVVMYSKLLPDIKTLNIFFSKAMLYVNGSMSYSGRIMYVNDIVQIIVSRWYYIFYRWLANWTILRVRKFKRLVYRKGLANRYRLMKTKKVKSRYIPNWINDSKFDSSDVKNHLEVDYFTLSAMVIYEPYVLDHHHFMELYEHKSCIYKMYNWKYIT